MGLKRQRPTPTNSSRVWMRRASLTLAIGAVACATATANATSSTSVDHKATLIVPSAGVHNNRMRWQRRLQVENSAVRVEAGVAAIAALLEERDGSGASSASSAPPPGTPAPSPGPSPAAEPGTPVTTPPATTPATTTSAPTQAPRPEDATAAPAPTTSAPTPAPSPAPEPTPSPPPPATADTPAPTPAQPPAPTTQPPAPTTQTPPPTTQTPPPTTSAPPSTTAPPPPPSPPATTAPPAPTPPPPSPPATTAPPAPTPPPPAPTTAAPTPTTAAPTPKPTPPSPTTPVPTTKKPPSPGTPAPTPTPTPTMTTKAPTTAPTNTPTPPPTSTSTPTPGPTPSTSPSTGPSSGSGARSPEATGNGKVIAPDLNNLPPIAGNDVVSPSSSRQSGDASRSSDSSGAAAKNTLTRSESGQNKISMLGIAAIVLGVVASVLVAIFFVHARRRRHADKYNDSTRQRQLDALFAPVGAPPIPHSGHPGAASIVSSCNGMVIAAPPPLASATLTPRSQIPVVSSHPFQQPRGRASGGRVNSGAARPMAYKARMDSIPQSPRSGGRGGGDSSDFDIDNDSFLGAKGPLSSNHRATSERSDFSMGSSSNGDGGGDFLTGPRSTGASSFAFSRGDSEARSTYFPMGMSESRSTMVQVGIAQNGPTARASLSDEFYDSLPRGASGGILVPRRIHQQQQDDDTASSVFTANSVSSSDDDDYGSPYHTRIERGDSSGSSASNPNLWSMNDSESDFSDRGFSLASSAALSMAERGDGEGLPPSGRSDDSYYYSEDESETSSYPYMNTGDRSNDSFLSFSSDGTAASGGLGTTSGRYSLEVEEGHI